MTVADALVGVVLVAVTASIAYSIGKNEGRSDVYEERIDRGTFCQCRTRPHRHEFGFTVDE